MTDKQMVAAAKLRSRITGWLKRHPGPHTVLEIAEALKTTVHVIGRACARMAEDGLIQKEASSGGKKQYSGTSGEADAEAPHAVAVPKARKVRTAKMTPEEVEVVVGGRTIIVGNNPATGRIRIIVEDVS